MFFSRVFKYLLFLFGALASQISFGDSPEIQFRRDSGTSEIRVPTKGDQSPSVFAGSDRNGKGFFFAAGIPAQNLTRRAGGSTDRKNNFIQLNLTDLELVYLSDNSVAAAIYPILSLENLQGTALHVLQNSPGLASDRQWFGFVDENNQLLDVALSSQNISIDSLQQVLQTFPEPKIDLQIQIPHLTLIQNTDDLTLSRSLSQILAASNKYFYFRNSETSHVGPQSSGSIVYDLTSEQPRPLGIISCLARVNSTGPDTNLIRAISLKGLARFQIIQLTPKQISQFKNNCQSYDKKGGGGD